MHMHTHGTDHMYRMAMCSFLVTDPGIDRARCVTQFSLKSIHKWWPTFTCVFPAPQTCVGRLMKIAVVHDLAEALVGDIVPHDTRYTKEQKRAMEEVGVHTQKRRLVVDGMCAAVWWWWFGESSAF